MYRSVIEHPQWIPKDGRTLDLRAGATRDASTASTLDGTAADSTAGQLDTAGLVAALDSPNGWQRDMVQKLLVWRQEKAAIPLLEKLVAESKRPLARLQALCTLDGLHALQPALLLKEWPMPIPACGGMRFGSVSRYSTRYRPELGVV